MQGGVYTVSVVGDKDSESAKIGTFKLTSENSVSMLWLIPQYFVMVIAEVFFSVTGLEFSYSQVFCETLEMCLQLMLSSAYCNHLSHSRVF
jgi:dipeptide/tripeptide permease